MQPDLDETPLSRPATPFRLWRHGETSHPVRRPYDFVCPSARALPARCHPVVT